MICGQEAVSPASHNLEESVLKGGCCAGSPENPVKVDGKEVKVGQCNNFWIFPGVDPLRELTCLCVCRSCTLSVCSYE